MTAKVVDLVRERAEEYATPSQPAWIRLAAGKLLAIEGEGPPGGKEFQRRLQALYGVAYTTKFAAKKEGRTFRVPPLEGEWHLPEASASGSPGPEGLRWRLQIPIPAFVQRRTIEAVKRDLSIKKRDVPVAEVRLERRRPSRSVQVLHVGPYSDETADLERISAFARAEGFEPEGWHTEIYLSDPRKVKPARLRTLLRRNVGRPRRPVRRGGAG